MTRYAAYVSEYKTPGLEDPTLDQQRQAIESWVAERDGELVAVYQDVTCGGRISDRPGLRRLCRDARDGKFDQVVVKDLSRLSRSPSYAIALQYMLWWDHDITIVSLADDLDAAKQAAGGDVNSLLDAVVDWYASERQPVIVDRSEWARRGLYFGRTPFGYDKRKGGILVPNQAEARVVQLMFETYAQGGHSDVDIAGMLNEAGYRTRRGAQFYKQAIRAMLTNRVYIGEVRHQPTVYDEGGKLDRSVSVKWYPGQHEPIIGRELFERCEELRIPSRKAQGK